MDKKVLEFLDKNRVCCLTTLLKDGSPHAAALHYSHSDQPLEIYISTENKSKKCEALLNGKSGKASFVIGFKDEDDRTLQMDGDVKVEANKLKIKNIQDTHYIKHPGSAQWKDDPATVFLVFKPTWWRYTEYKPEFEVISSDK